MNESTERRRHWLRPEWHVTYLGNVVAEKPFPPWPDLDESIPHPCTKCGVECYPGGEGASYDLPTGRLCIPCGDELPMPPPLSPWMRAWLYVDCHLHTLYWRYAERFGRRYYHGGSDSAGV